MELKHFGGETFIVKWVGHIWLRYSGPRIKLALSRTQKVEVSLGMRLESTDSVLLLFNVTKSMYLM